MEEVHGVQEHSLVISVEHLAAASEEQVHRAVTSLEPCDVHVIYTVRDLATLIPSEWQEYVKHGETMDFAPWAEKTLTSRSATPQPWFWQVHDVPRVLERWSSGGATTLHVVVVPERGGSRRELWERFVGVMGVEPSGFDLDVPSNPSLGPVETEVLRHLNLSLGDRMSPWQRFALVRDLLATEILSGRSTPLQLGVPRELRSLVVETSRSIVAAVRSLDVQVVGDLASLEVTSVPERGDPPPLAAEAVVEAQRDALVGLLNAVADERATLRLVRQEAAEKLERVTSRLDQVRGERDACRNQLAEVYESRSWRFTAPLRRRPGRRRVT